jgi:tetratricopeptide (TPR) repeat protein
MLILALLGLAILWMSRRPVLSFAIFFFFLNHIIESSVIGLELVFEHRNYLPSLFLFMPVAQGIKVGIKRYGTSPSNLPRLLNIGVLLLVVALGTGTYVRNMAWANERTLWEDTLFKAPNSIRAHHELAYQYYEKSGQYDAALSLYHQGLQLSGQSIYEKALSLNNIASIHFTRGEYDLAEMYWKKAITSFPKYKNAYYRLSLTQKRLGKRQEAAETLSRIGGKESMEAVRLNLQQTISSRDLGSDTVSKSYRKLSAIPKRD